MSIININELPPTPWKNGGGTTREIAQADGPKGFAWRLSVADVEVEGPFSRFEGFSRILTVIEGHGLQLCTTKRIHEIALLDPFHFRGDVDISSKLQSGSIRDFNVIYDHDSVAAHVSVVRGPAGFDCIQTEMLTTFVFGAEGSYVVDRAQMGGGVVFQANQHLTHIEVPKGSTVLLVKLTIKIC